jgi:predicted nucleic acid-binding protein
MFPAEIRSVLLKLERRGRFDATFTAKALESLAVYDIDVDVAPDATAYDAILDLARGEQLEVYDTLYLWHAMQRSIALASRDRRLLSAAASRGVVVFDLLGDPSWPSTN